MAHNNQGSGDPNWPYSQPSQPNSFGPSSQPTGPFGLILSADELRVLRECNNESFYYRSVPLSFLFSGLAHIGVKNGYLSGSPRFGSGPKMLLGVVIGFFAGKISYNRKCADKFVNLPNSKLGERIRKRRGLPLYQEEYGMNSDLSEGPMNFSQSQFHNFHEGREGFDKVTEDLRPYSGGDAMLNKNTGSVSYDELRRKNREPLSSSSPQNRSFSAPKPYYDNPNRIDSDISPDSTSDLPVGNITPTPQTPYFDRRKNKYGDIWDD